MFRALQESWTLFLGLLLLMISNGLLVTLLTLRGAELGFSQTTIGIMQACYPLGALVGCVVAPRLIEQVGHIRTFGALASLCSTSALIHMLTQDPFSWSAMRFLAGFCFTGLYVIAESWLNARAQNQNRAAILSIYFIVQTGGSASGVAMVGLPDPTGGLLFAMTSILVSICLVPMLITRIQAPDYSAPDRLSIRTLIGISPMAVSGAVLNGMVQVALFVGLPLYGLALGMSGGQAASLLVIVTLSGAVSQFPIGWLSDRVDRRLVVAGASLIGTVLFCLLALGPSGVWLYVTLAGMAAVTFPIYSLCVAHANDRLLPNQIVPASGTLVMALNVGSLTGALLGPAAIRVFGASGFMIVMAGLAFITFGIAWLRTSRSAAPLETGPTTAIAAVGAQGIGELTQPDHSIDPRNETL